MGAVNGLGGAAAGSTLGSVAMGPAGAVAGGVAGGQMGASNLMDALSNGFNKATGSLDAGASPDYAQILQGTNAQQLGQAYNGAQQGLSSQQQLLAALQGQNGLGNQSSVFNQQQALANQLAGANAIGTQNAAIQAQQGLAQQYQNIANGQGPNPAQAMLNQATGQNVANQAALMAGQRGAGSNVGLLARQAAQQGAATQQQAVGQGATLQAQQQLNALGQVGAAQNAAADIAGQQLGAQQAQQGALANLAGTQASQQIGATTALSQAQQAEQQQLLGALSAQNQANVGAQSSVNAGNTALKQTSMQGQQGLLGGVLNSAGPAAKLLTSAAPVAAAAAAKGGKITKKGVQNPENMADGGSVSPGMPQNQQGMSLYKAPTMPFSDFLSSWNGGAQQPMNFQSGGLAATGGHVNAKNSSQKAVKGGDSYANDKIPAMLSEGEIVIPRHITMGNDPVGGAAKFVAALMAKKGKK